MVTGGTGSTGGMAHQFYNPPRGTTGGTGGGPTPHVMTGGTGGAGGAGGAGGGNGGTGTLKPLTGGTGGTGGKGGPGGPGGPGGSPGGLKPLTGGTGGTGGKGGPGGSPGGLKPLTGGTGGMGGKGGPGGPGGPGGSPGGLKPLTGGTGGPGGPGGTGGKISTGPTPKGSKTLVTKGGSTITTRSNGKLSNVYSPKGGGINIHHGLNGNKTITSLRPNHGKIFSAKGRPGFVQHGYNFHGRNFGRRNYFYHGHQYSRFYRGWGFRGLWMDVYAPGFFFTPGFYSWAYNPWPAPVALAVVSAGSPWYVYYGYYFQADPTYPSAEAWLTDDIISTDLQTGYAAQQQAGEMDGAPQAEGGAPILTPEIKQQIADEVRTQLALENQEGQQAAQGQDTDPGSSGIGRILADVANGHPHVFVAGGALDLTDANGQECAISDGDVLQLQTAPPSDATTANLFILASKGGNECARADTVTVQLTDLQEMQNQLRANIDQGLQDLQAKQGQGGLPQAPPTAQAPPTQAPYAAIAPPPDPADANTVQQQDQQANQAEQQATTDQSQGAPPAGQPPPDGSGQPPPN
jgi:hypothetical protein